MKLALVCPDCGKVCKSTESLDAAEILHWHARNTHKLPFEEAWDLVAEALAERQGN